MLAVPPEPLPPLQNAVESPQLGHRRPFRCSRPLTRNTFVQTGHRKAALLPAQSSSGPRAIGSR
jgi:hypothetical protein